MVANSYHMVVTGMIGPSDYEFCGNGIVFADRTLTPKLQTVKHLYSNIKIAVDEKSVTIKNDNVFEDLSAYTFLLEFTKMVEKLAKVNITLMLNQVKKQHSQ